MSYKITTFIRNWSRLPWDEFRDLLTWPGSSALQADNPNLIIATTKNTRGNNVCFATAENILLVDGYVASPNAPESELQSGGDAIDECFATEAAKAGVGRMWIVLPTGAPKEPGEKYLRFVERKVSYSPRIPRRKFRTNPT